jgi:hypothetical protein
MPSRPAPGLRLTLSPQRRARAGALLLALLLAVLHPGPARAEQDMPPVPPPGPIGEREVTVSNRSDLAIIELYVSPTTADSWGDDRLGENLLEPRKSLRVRLGRMRDCSFDMLIIYEDSSREERPLLNLCRTRQVTLDGRARSAPTLPGPAPREVAFANQSGRAIQQIFISPADGAAWGDDLLGRSISIGERGTVTWRGGCTVDIRVVFENRAAEERRGIDLCSRSTLSIEPGWTTADDPPAPPA